MVKATWGTALHAYHKLLILTSSHFTVLKIAKNRHVWYSGQECKMAAAAHFAQIKVRFSDT